MRPEERGLDPLDRAALREPHRQAAEPLGERQERRQRRHLLGADRGDVDRGGDGAAGQRGDDLLARSGSPARSVASAVDAPRCGVTTTFG